MGFRVTGYCGILVASYLYEWIDRVATQGHLAALCRFPLWPSLLGFGLLCLFAGLSAVQPAAYPHFTLTSPGDDTGALYELIATETAPLIHLSVDGTMNTPGCDGTMASPAHARCDWRIPLRKCPDRPGDAGHEGLDCVAELIIRSPWGRPFNNVSVCENGAYLLSGFFRIRYLRGHFGKEFYEARPVGDVDPTTALATLAQQAPDGCYRERQ